MYEVTLLFTSILLFIWILKLMAICNAIRWLHHDGTSYKEYIEEHSPILDNEYDQAFEACNGNKLPFGIKDYKLRRFAKRIEGIKAVTFIARFFQAWLFRFNWLIGVTAFYLFFVGWLIPPSRVPTSFTLYLLALLALGSNIPLSIEAIYAYSTLESYAVSFHMQSREKKGLSGDLLLFIKRVLTTVISGATACYVAYIRHDALAGHITPPEPGDLYNQLKIYLQCVYFTATTFATVGYGDIYPNNGMGQLIAFLVEIQSFALVVIVFASLLASRSQQKSDGAKSK